MSDWGGDDGWSWREVAKMEKPRTENGKFESEISNSVFFNHNCKYMRLSKIRNKCKKIFCQNGKNAYLYIGSFHHASHLNSEPGWNFCFRTSYAIYTTFDFATQ